MIASILTDDPALITRLEGPESRRFETIWITLTWQIALSPDPSVVSQVISQLPHALAVSAPVGVTVTIDGLSSEEIWIPTDLNLTVKKRGGKALMDTGSGWGDENQIFNRHGNN